MEPLNGGDVRFEIAQSIYVEQHKSRSTQNRWNATEIISEVLPDLWRAENDIQHKSGVHYAFVTNGRGPAAPFRNFLKACQEVSEPDDLSKETDASVRAFNANLSHSALFLRIASTLGVKEEKYQRLFCLLQNLSITADVDRVQTEAAIDNFLRGLTSNPREITGKRSELVGQLFRLGAEGKTITTVSLLNECGLPIERLSAGVAAQARCSEKLTSDLKRMGYDYCVDARKAPPLLPETSTVFLKGESGAGKSWLVSRWADDLRNRGLSAIVLREVSSENEVAVALNQVIWIPAGFSSFTDIRTIAARIRKDQPTEIAYWLTIFLDDPEAACLEPLARQGLASIGIRIVIASARIDEDRVRRSFGAFSAIDTPLLTLEESKCLLVKNGPLSEAGWRSLPPDMMRLMRRPMTAFLYRETARLRTFEPRTEYELMEAYWQSLQDRPALHAGDLSFLDRLVLSLLEDTKLYPWPFTLVHQLIPDDAVRERLTTAGVLQVSSSDGWVMEHDRVLNWAVARALFQTEYGNAAPIATVAERYITLRDRNAKFGSVSWRLGYLLMDILAVALKTRPNSDVLAFLKILSENHQQSDFDSSFYTSLLPTLGSAALPFYESAVGERGKGERPLPLELAKGLITISQSEPQAVILSAGHMLSSDNDDAVLTALKIGVTLPLTEHLEILWRHHKKINVEYANDPRRFHELKTSSQAFGLALAEAPEFLSTLLDTALTDEELISVLWRLANIPHQQGEPIWSKHKSMVFARLPHEGRLLAVLADVFDDMPSLHQAASLLEESHDDLAPAYQMGVLSRRDPKAAFELLDRAGLEQLEFTANWWLDDLIDMTGNEGQALLIQHASQQENGAWSLSRCFSHVRHLANEETLTFIAQDILARIKQLRCDSSLNSRPITDALRLFAGANPDSLQKALLSIDAECLFDHLAYFLTGKDKNAWDSFSSDIENAILTAFGTNPDNFAIFVSALLDATEPRRSWDLLQVASLIKHQRLGEAVARMANKWNHESGPLSIVAIPLIAQARFRELFLLLVNAEHISWIAEGVTLQDHMADCANQFTDMERQQILEDFDRVSNDKCRSCIIDLIGFLKINEAEHRLRGLVSDEQTDGSIRIAAAKGLCALDCDKKGLGALAGSFLKSTQKNNSFFKSAADLCLKLNDQEAKDSVREYFQSKTDGSYSGIESQLLSWLVRDADLKTLEEILAENSTRFVREELEGVIRNVKARLGHESIAAELEDLALSPGRGIFGRDNAADALRSLAAINPDTAFDIAASRILSQTSAENVAQLWSLDPERALDFVFGQIKIEIKPSIVRLIGRKLSIHSPDQNKLIEKVCENCLSNHPESRRFAVAILAWLEGDEIEKMIRKLTKDPDRRTSQEAQKALKAYHRQSSARRSREKLGVSSQPLAFLHLNRVLSDGDWKLTELGEKTTLGLPDSPLFGSLHAENYVRNLLRTAREEERRERD